MQVVILAAGYATRLYPLTRTRPKPLLPVAGKPMVDYVLDNLATVAGLERVFLVTNARFAGQFQEWADHFRATKARLDFTIVNDGSTDDSNKLGAIGDLNLVLVRERVDSDVIVVAADNLFDSSLEGFVAFARQKQAAVVALYDVGSLEEARKHNALRLDGDGRIIAFEEKPRQTASTLCAIALYYYPRAALPLIRRYVEEGNNPDQPGRLVAWLHTRIPFYTWRVPGLWFDIGSKEGLEEANRVFARR